jgi:hypothetical protein
MICDARQCADAMRCATCGLQWDTNDPEPPSCGRALYGVRAVKTNRTRARFERYALVSGKLPLAHGSEPGTYADARTNAAFHAFKAALALPG